MRRIFLENLPRRKEGIDWNASVGRKISFIYDDIKGEIEIVSYNSIKGKFELRYGDESIKTLYLSNLKKCKIAKIIDKRRIEHYFDIGQDVDGLKIIKKKRMEKYNSKRIEKGYIVECNGHKQGLKVHRFPILETELRNGRGCPICSGKVCVKGVNDIAITAPELVRYLAYKEDAFRFTRTSGKSIQCRCPDCGCIKEMKVSNLWNRGFCCSQCGDGISYPNKFMFNALTQLGIEFENEYAPEWSSEKKQLKRKSNRKFDFYIPSKALIIEMDGNLGHGGCVIKSSGLTSQDTLDIDMWKEQQAELHGIKVIRIDCRYKEEDKCKYIRNSIKNSELNSMFDWNKVDFEICDEFSQSNRLKEACKLWDTNKFKSTSKLAEKMKLSASTIRKYLKKGTEFKWCYYNAKEERLKWASINGKKTKKNLTIDNVSKKTIAICEIWNSGIYSSTKIGEMVNLSSRNVIRHLQDGVKLEICDYSAEKAKEFARQKAIMTIKSNTKKVRVVGVENTFMSIAEMIEYFVEKEGIQLSASKVSSVCNGSRKTHKGFKFEYVMDEI